MKKWEKFNKEELEEILKNSSSLKEVAIKLGYNTYRKNIIEEIVEKFPEYSNLLQIIKQNKYKRIWENFNEQELKEKIQNSSSLENFCINIGYKNYSSKALKEIKENFPALKEQLNNIKAGNQIEDLTGKQFGYLTVLSYNKELSSQKKQTYWTCKCICGNITNVEKQNLINGRISTCGCKIKRNEDQKKKREQLIGEKFNKLTILSVDEEKTKEKKRTYYNCICDCGNKTIVPASQLFNGHTKSCGCYSEEVKRLNNLIDLTGQTFGYWKVLKRDTSTPKKGGARFICECQGCKEHTIKSVPSQYLRNGDSVSCGCMTRSFGETLILNILKENNITYKQQYSFPNLKGIKNRSLSYDFAIFNKQNQLKILIEFQGIQHYYPITFFGGEEQFNIQKEHDKRKREYAQNNNIKLLEIPYIDKTKIDLNYLNQMAGEDLCQL